MTQLRHQPWLTDLCSMLVSSGRHAGSGLKPAQQPSVFARRVLVVAIRSKRLPMLSLM